LRAAARLVLLISAAKPAKPFCDEEPDADVLATLANAACLTRAGELTRRFLVGWCSSGTSCGSSSSEEREAGGLAFRFPLEERRDIGSAERRLRYDVENERGELMWACHAITWFINNKRMWWWPVKL
jgi:hypothetical protein